MDQFWIEHRTDAENFHLNRHYEHSYQLLFILNGKVKYTVGDKDYVIERSNLIALNTLEEHTLEVLEYPYERILIQIDPAWFQSEIKDTGLISLFIQRSAKFSHLLTLKESTWMEVYDILTEMLDEVTDQKDYWEMMIRGDIRRLFVKLERECPDHFHVEAFKSSSRVAYRVLHYIDSHFVEDISVDTVAEHLYLSRHYISHTFKDEIGYSIMEYIILLRMNRAKALLLQNNIAITEVALECGYEDFAYFSRIFKKKTGMTPTQFRKRLQKD